jgi:hypothetical protein
LALPQAHYPSREDLCDLGQAFLGGHEIGRQRIAAGKAPTQTMGSDAGVFVHLAAIASYMASL